MPTAQAFQEEDLIAKIHNEELPPEEYCVALEQKLKIKFPNSEYKEREHIIALAAAFDTAAGYGKGTGAVT